MNQWQNETNFDCRPTRNKSFISCSLALKQVQLNDIHKNSHKLMFLCYNTTFNL